MIEGKPQRSRKSEKSDDFYEYWSSLRFDAINRCKLLNQQWTQSIFGKKHTKIWCFWKDFECRLVSPSSLSLIAVDCFVGFFSLSLWFFDRKFFFSSCARAHTPLTKPNQNNNNENDNNSNFLWHSASLLRHFWLLFFVLSLIPFCTLTTQISFVWNIKKLLEWHFSYLSFSFSFRVTRAATVKYAHCVHYRMARTPKKQ